jgi:drug/metabolite transporter (DMT)-like permease
MLVVALPATKGELTLPLNDILLCLFWGCCLSGFVNWTFIVASRHLATAEVTLLMLIEFALGPLWVWWFVGEVPHRWTLIGGADQQATTGSKSNPTSLTAISQLLSKLPPEFRFRDPEILSSSAFKISSQTDQRCTSWLAWSRSCASTSIPTTFSA